MSNYWEVQFAALKELYPKNYTGYAALHDALFAGLISVKEYAHMKDIAYVLDVRGKR